MDLKQQMTLGQFVEQRLGGERDAAALLKKMFILSLGAESFREFWRYWNPVYGYFLYYYCYRPLRGLLPTPLCVIATFGASGFFLHDLPFGWWIRAIRMQRQPLPFVALWFLQIGLIVLLTDALNLTWRNQPLMVRALLNVGWVVLPFLSTLYLQAVS